MKWDLLNQIKWAKNNQNQNDSTPKFHMEQINFQNYFHHFIISD